MSPAHSSVQFGKTAIAYKVFFVNRKTLEIAVHPDRTVVVKAPDGTSFDVVEAKVLKRAGWIIRQLDYFRQFEPRTPKRNYVGGESHLYLGRRYRLKVHRNQGRNEVKLMQGFFHIYAKDDSSPGHIKQRMDNWYAEKASVKFHDSFERCWPRFSRAMPTKPNIALRHMKKRWGSLSNNGRLTLNIDLIRAPKECIDYVITHELCHLRHHDHGPDFYRLLENMMPDWERRKAKLELSMV
ncbi:MAG: SprT family zinc-dependent metalloprotease [Desulfobacteraceae bacterium]|nr:SprT family zinc-dependent metalloprotease [Desulfobacteraceae bacterium]